MALQFPKRELGAYKEHFPPYFEAHPAVADLMASGGLFLPPELIQRSNQFQHRKRFYRLAIACSLTALASTLIIGKAIAVGQMAGAMWLLVFLAILCAWRGTISAWKADQLLPPLLVTVLVSGVVVPWGVLLLVRYLVAEKGDFAATERGAWQVILVGAGGYLLVALGFHLYSRISAHSVWQSDDRVGGSKLVLRGREVARVGPLISASLAHVIETQVSPKAESQLLVKTFDLFGAVPVVRGSTSNNHKLFVGMSGSGKTLSFRMLMASMLPLPRHAGDAGTPNLIRRTFRQETHQAIVYDAKTENVPILMSHGFQPGKDLYILNPFDQRAVAWDLAKDFRTPAQAKLLAKVFLDSHRKGQHLQQHEYFRDNAARQITGVIQAFIAHGGKDPQWTLRDIINAFSTPEMLRHVLSQHPEGGSLIANTIEVAHETATGIYSSSTTYIDEFRIVASLWHRLAHREHAPGEATSISLEEWVTSKPRSVLLLPNTRENEAVLAPMNRLLFQRLSQLLLDSRYNQHIESGPGQKYRRTLFLDECSQLGKLEGLSDLLTEGRQFGVQVILGVQSYSQMVSAYGEQDAKTIVGQCGFKAFLKSDGDTAQWASKEIGQQLERYSKMSYTSGTSGSYTVTSGSLAGSSSSDTSGWSRSQSESYEERLQDAVLASEISGLPDPRTSGLFGGIYVTPHLPVFVSNLEFRDLPALLESAVEAPARVPMDSGDEWLPPWTEEDFQRLGLPLPPKQNQKRQPQLSAPQPHFEQPKVAKPSAGKIEDLFD